MLGLWPLRYGGDDRPDLWFLQLTGRGTEAHADGEYTLPSMANPSRRGVSCIVGFATIASVVAVLFLVSCCVVVPSVKQSLGTSTTRRLADKEEAKYDDSSTRTLGYICESQVLEERISTRPTESPELTKPDVGEARCIAHRKREREEDPYGPFADENDEYCVRLGEREGEESRDLQKLPENLPTLSLDPLDNRGAGSSHLKSYQLLDHYIEEALAADEAGLSLDAWLLDPTKEMPASPTILTHPLGEEPPHGIDGQGALVSAVPPTTFARGTLLRALMERQFLESLQGPYKKSVPSSEATKSRAGSRVSQAGTLSHASQFSPTQQHSQLVNNDQARSHPLEQYIEEVLAADEAGLSLDAWLLDPTKEMPSRPSSSELQRTSEESSNDEDDEEAHSSAAAPTSFEGGTSLSGVMAQHFLEGLLGPSGSSVPSSEATKSREGSRVLQASTLSHDSQFSPTQQHSQLVNNDQTHSHPLEQYIEEVLAADEAGLSLDAWLLDPTKEMPSRPASSELQRTSEESSNDEDDGEAHSSAAAPTSFEGGTSLSGVMAQHFLEGLQGPSKKSVPSSEATKSREGSRVLQASTLSHDSQFSPTQQHSQLVNNDQTHSHPLEQYIEEVLAADEAGLSLDAWLLDPTKEMPSRPASSELQRTSEESSNDEDDGETHSSAAAPTSFEGGTSLSGVMAQHFLEGLQGPSKKSVPSSEATKSREGSRVLQASTLSHDSQFSPTQQHSQLVNNDQTHSHPLEQYIEEVLAADEAGLSLDAWLLDPTKEMPSRPASSELQRTSEESSNDEDDGEAHSSAAAPTSFEGGTSLSGVMAQHFLEGLQGPSKKSVPSSEATKSREGSRVLQASTLSHDSQFSPTQQHSQLVNNDQTHSHPLEQYIEEVLAADEAGLSLDAWLLDPAEEVPRSPSSSELQRTSEESSNDEDDEAVRSSAAAPATFEGGTSLSGVVEQHFLEGLLGPSGSSVPSSEATKSREGSRVLQASTQSHASQILTNHQRRQRVEGKQQSIEMKGQRGDDGLRHQSSRVETSVVKAINTHPFFRLPSVVPGAFVREFRKENIELVGSRRFNYLQSLLIVKDCLKLPQLDWYHLDTLTTHVELLVGYATLQMDADVERAKPKVAVERLAFCLIVIDSLYAASEVWGPRANRDEWWGGVVSAIPEYRGPTKRAASFRAAKENIRLAQSLHGALDIYRSGKRPSADVLVPLKQTIFCTTAVPRFHQGQWLKWCMDDAEWCSSP